MKKNIIVVTGGAGFVGSNLVNFLLNKTKFKIISLDNYSTGRIKNHLKSSKVSNNPSVKDVLLFHPYFFAKLISSNFLGTPSGFVLS